MAGIGVGRLDGVDGQVGGAGQRAGAVAELLAAGLVAGRELGAPGAEQIERHRRLAGLEGDAARRDLDPGHRQLRAVGRIGDRVAGDLDVVGAAGRAQPPSQGDVVATAAVAPDADGAAAARQAVALSASAASRAARRAPVRLEARLRARRRRGRPSAAIVVARAVAIIFATPVQQWSASIGPVPTKRDAAPLPAGQRGPVTSIRAPCSSSPWAGLRLLRAPANCCEREGLQTFPGGPLTLTLSA